MSGAQAVSANAAQVDYWNSAAGETWARFQQLLDRQVEPLGAQAMRQLAISPGERVVDIGCGCGQTSLELAARVGPAGRIVGVDISVPMLEVARRRLGAEAGSVVEFRRADAQCDDLGRAIYDAAYSRFGVMFFSDPIAAFANIRRSLKSGGRLGFVCWRSLEDNAWMREPLAAAPALPPAEPPEPAAPGPFAFADCGRVRAILDESGFSEVTIDPFDTRIGCGGVEEALDLALRVGPLGSRMREHPQLMSSVAGAVRSVLQRFATPQGVLMPAGVWIVQARK